MALLDLQNFIIKLLSLLFREKLDECKCFIETHGSEVLNFTPLISFSFVSIDTTAGGDKIQINLFCSLLNFSWLLNLLHNSSLSFVCSIHKSGEIPDKEVLLRLATNKLFLNYTEISSSQNSISCKNQLSIAS